MTVFGRRFRPTLLSLLLTVTAVSIFALLGNWQLERAAYKQELEDRFERRLQQDFERFDADQPLEDLQYRRLVFEGSWDHERQFLLDNQTHRGRAGYHVLTPLYLRDSDAVLLVNRGWVAWGESRADIPPLLPASQSGKAAGIVFYPGDPALRLGTYTQGENWPRLVPYVDFDELQPMVTGQLLPFVLWLAPERPGAYVRDWDPIWLPPEKSRAYALQWFAFAAIALALFVILNLRKEE